MASSVRSVPSRQDIRASTAPGRCCSAARSEADRSAIGGKTARLLFCRIMLQKPNVLILDEPTNHLDLESINALNIALQKFDGTILLVTHDQDLLEEVGTNLAIRRFDRLRVAPSEVEGRERKDCRLQGNLRGNDWIARVAPTLAGAFAHLDSDRRLVVISHFKDGVILHHEKFCSVGGRS